MEKNIKKLKKYWLEIVLLTLALVISLIAMIIYLQSSKEIDNDAIVFEKQESLNNTSQYIFVDLSGEILKPNVYKIKPGTRLKQLVDLSGGLTDKADHQFFYRNYNLARVLNDQEKIYIPSISEIDDGYFTENSQLIDYLSIKSPAPQDIIININDTTVDELDTLPGVGLVTANKIIANQPYQLIDDLLTKKIVKKNVFESIKNLISVK